MAGHDAITRHLQERADRSAHHTVNTQVEEGAHGIRARSRIVVIGYDAAVHTRDVVDTIVPTADGWRISRRQDRRRTRSRRSAEDAGPRSDPAPSKDSLKPVLAHDGYAILDVLARYAHVIDNADWDRLGTVFTSDVTFRGRRSAVQGWAGIAEMIGAVRPYYPHHTTDVLLGARTDGTVRAWSKYFIVRDDGTAGSGDYLDTFVRMSGAGASTPAESVVATARPTTPAAHLSGRSPSRCGSQPTDKHGERALASCVSRRPTYDAPRSLRQLLTESG